MRQKWGVIVELNPPDHAMLLQILPYFRFADLQMLGQLSLEAAVRGIAASSTPAALAASGPSASPAHQVSNADAKRLAGFHVIGTDLIGIGKQKYAWAGRSLIRFVQSVERARH